MENGRKIRILLADDHQMVLAGIRGFLVALPNIEIVGEAYDGVQAVQKALDLLPDILLMDIGMPNLNGLEASKLILAEAPAVNIIALTMYENKEYVRRLVESGIRGYVLKSSPPQDLICAIETVHRGEPYFSDTVTKIIVNDYVNNAGKRASAAESTELSERETEVLIFIAQGFSNKEIADRLNASIRTIENHRGKIMRKLNIHSVAGLTRYAIEKGHI